jgi:hypothetical protein
LEKLKGVTSVVDLVETTVYTLDNLMVGRKAENLAAMSAVPLAATMAVVMVGLLVAHLVD